MSRLIASPGSRDRPWANLLRHTSFSVASNAQRTPTYASHCWLPRASSGSQLDPASTRYNLNWAGGTATVDAMKQLTVAALGLWLGAMGFFAFVVAPAAFSTLDREAAGRFVSAVFPKYYAAGFGLGLVALASLVVRVLGRGVRPLV